MRWMGLLLMGLFVHATVWAAPEDYYNVLFNAPEKNSYSVVVYEEFLNFGCPHCYNFHLASHDLRAKYKDKVQFIDRPIAFRGQSDAPIRLFYVASKNGMGEKAKDALFKARFVNQVDVFDPAVVNFLARSIGLGDQYNKDQNADYVQAALQENSQQADKYGIRATPTIILAETLQMQGSGSIEALAKRTDETIDMLLK